jgi:hypothetical protein
MDQLVGLGVEFDLADSPAAFFEVEAGADQPGGLGGRTNLRGQSADLGDRPEVQALAPDERPDCVEESLARRQITGAGAGADECGAFPG